MLNLLNKAKANFLPVIRGSVYCSTKPIAVEETNNDKEAKKIPPKKATGPPLILTHNFKENYEPCSRSLCRQAWIENLDTVEEQKLGLIELHPDIFAAQPRVDVIQENIEWQRKYRYVSTYVHARKRLLHCSILKYIYYNFR